MLRRLCSRATSSSLPAFRSASFEMPELASSPAAPSAPPTPAPSSAPCPRPERKFSTVWSWSFRGLIANRPLRAVQAAFDGARASELSGPRSRSRRDRLALVPERLQARRHSALDEPAGRRDAARHGGERVGRGARQASAPGSFYGLASGRRLTGQPRRLCALCNG
jgi:hypothetical protein